MDKALLRFSPDGMIEFDDTTFITGSCPCPWSFDLVFFTSEPKDHSLRLLLNCSQTPLDKVLYILDSLFARNRQFLTDF